MSIFDTDDDVEEGPKGNQGQIIDADDYPMRVLAGAGTGKTFTMVRKIERLLQTDQTSPQNVLALTFTNKAADSMRTKLNGRVGADGYDIDAYTYHSICHSILQDYPYHAGLPSGFTIASDADKYELAQIGVKDVPYQFLSPDGTYRDAPEEVLLDFISSMKQEEVRPEALAAYLPEPSVILELHEMADRIESAARGHIRRQSVSDGGVEGFCEDLETFSLTLQLEQQSLDSTPFLEDISGYLQTLIETVEQFKYKLRTDTASITNGDKQAAARLPGVLFSAYGTEGERMTTKSDFPTGIPKLPYTLLDRLRSYLEDCEDAVDLVHGYQTYEARRKEAQLVDFDDLITKTVSLLEDDDIAAEIAGQWEYVFCDEFQDTDGIQFELVTTLSEHTELFIVGDDDQAIYEWRGAESENIGRKLTETYQSELVDMELDLNFRSKQPILDLANNAISSLEGRGSDKTLTAFGENADATDGVAHIDTTPSDETDLDDEEYQAEQITSAVSGLLRGDFDTVEEEYDLGDVAVLVRKNRHARPLIDSFTDAGIPFELVGDLSTESIGVETVVAYLRALATPSNDVAVRRVLLMRYRLSEHDLRVLAESADRLVDAVRAVDPATLEEPDRLKTARDDFEHLFARRTQLSVEHLYYELLQTTDIEWYLTRTERRELQGLEDLIGNYGEPASQPPIDEAFIEYLNRHDDIAAATDGDPTEQTEGASNAVSFMTVHQAKGLDFPVVIMPSLIENEWSPRGRDYAELVDAIGGTRFWEFDQLRRDLREARRLLHVGITRAEDHLLLFGQADGRTTSDEGVTRAYTQEWFGNDVEWDPTAASFPIWEHIQENLPASAEDWTGIIANHSIRRSEAVAEHDGDNLDYDDAIARVLNTASGLIDGTLEVAPASLGIPQGAFSAIPNPSMQRRHSYTSIGTVDTCARQHYLNHVVYAYNVPDDSGNWVGQETSHATPSTSALTTGGASNREIGTLFHETAEAAIKQGRTDQVAWQETCRQQAVELGLEAAVDGAIECIERFFQTPVVEWELLSAEHPFAIDIDGDTVVGEIDCLARRPDGELVVLDYKATSRAKAETNRQLPLYLLACAELFDEPIRTAGYVYVSEIGPDIDIRTYDDERLDEAKARIKAGLGAANSSSYEEYTAGEHCRFCPHNDLPCSGVGPN